MAIVLVADEDFLAVDLVTVDVEIINWLKVLWVVAANVLSGRIRRGGIYLYGSNR